MGLKDKAFKLFSEGKDLVDIMIALDIQPNQVREIIIAWSIFPPNNVMALIFGL